MNYKRLIVILGLSLVGLTQWAITKGAAKNPTKAESAAPQQQTMGMSEEMTAKMKEFSTPNENHRVLDQFVGSWENTLKLWTTPDTEPKISQGTTETLWTLDGHFIEQKFNGTHMDEPFEGRGFIGFDNLKKEYVSVWLDSLNTGLTISASSYDPDSKTFTEKGSFSCPIENGPLSYRAVTQIIDENTYTYTMYMPDKNGNEFKSMEITYSRKK